MFSKKQQIYICKGFLLIDGLVAIAVLTIGLAATVSLVTAGLKQYYGSRDIIVATGLAQEGVELIRNIRDNNFAQMKNNPYDAATNPNGWESGDSFRYFPNNQSCVVDKNYGYEKDYTAPNRPETVDLNCGGGSSLNYKLRMSGNSYVAGGGSGDKFSRKIRINTAGGSNDAEVTSFVWWGSGGEPSNSGSDCDLGNQCVSSKVVLKPWLVPSVAP